jgi:hypothetical protein
MPRVVSSTIRTFLAVVLAPGRRLLEIVGVCPFPRDCASRSVLPVGRRSPAHLQDCQNIVTARVADCRSRSYWAGASTASSPSALASTRSASRGISEAAIESQEGDDLLEASRRDVSGHAVDERCTPGVVTVPSRFIHMGRRQSRRGRLIVVAASDPSRRPTLRISLPDEPDRDKLFAVGTVDRGLPRQGSTYMNSDNCADLTRPQCGEMAHSDGWAAAGIGHPAVREMAAAEPLRRFSTEPS